MKNIKVFALVLLVALLVTLQLETRAQEAKDTNVANLSSAGSSVRFDIRTSYSVATLIVSAPDGRVFRQDTKSRAPEFLLTDKQGERLPDGQYSYELRLATPVATATRFRDDEPEETRAARKRAPTSAVIQSGGFSVVNGVVVVGGGTEDGDAKPVSKVAAPAPTRLTGAASAAITKIRQHHLAVVPDQVIPDDLIVQGSACVGLDCVNGEVFGFDSVRLKENNTRLQFDDTSSSAGFATNNWQIRANDSPSGGSSFLGFVDQGATGNSETGTIVFRTDAGAPANSLRVSSTGRIGLRTATPVLDVHANTSDTPAIRLEQNNSGGFSAQTWDIAGNEANFFVRDVTSGSRLPFRIRPGAPTSSIDIAASGNVGIGTGSPQRLVHVHATAGPVVQMTDNTTGATATDGMQLIQNGLNTFLENQEAGTMTLRTSATDRLTITAVGNVGINTAAPTDTLSVNGTASKPGGGTWAVFSDERLKTIKGDFTAGLKAVMQLQPLRYEYLPNNALGISLKGEHVGFGAQALQKVIPEAVSKTDQGYLVVNNDPIIWTMLNAIKEQQREIAELKEEVKQLRATSRKQ